MNCQGQLKALLATPFMPRIHTRIRRYVWGPGCALAVKLTSAPSSTYAVRKSRVRSYRSAARAITLGNYGPILNVADLAVAERDLQVLVHIDLLRAQIHDLLRLALDRLHIVDGQAE